MDAAIRRYRYPLIAVAVVLVILLIDWIAWLSPEGNKLSSLQATETQLSTEHQSLKTQVATLLSERRQLPRNCASLSKDLTEIPSSASIASFYSQVTQLASSSGVSTPSITISSGGASAGSPPSGSTSPAATPGVPAGLSTVGITLSVTGNYGQVSSFIHGLDGFPRLYTISTLDVTGGPIVAGGSTVATGSGSYSVDLTGSIFFDTAEHGLAALCRNAASAHPTKG